MPIFTEASTLVKAVEIHLVSESEGSVQLWSYFRRLIWIPAKFLKMGIGEKLRDAFAWALLALAFTVLGTWFIGDSGDVKVDAMNVLVFSATIISMFLAVFALPSIYGSSGVSPKTVGFVVEFLSGRGFLRVKEIELLKMSVKPFEDRARSRVTSLKWLVGVLWTSFLFVWAKSVDVSALTSTQHQLYVFMLMGLSAGLFAAYLCVWGYEASLDKLFRAIEFGCNDFSHILELFTPAEAGKVLEANAVAQNF